MNKVNSVTDCLKVIDSSMIHTKYFVSIEHLEEIHNFLINMSAMEFLEKMIVISNVLKYISYIIDEYQSLDVEKYEAIRKWIIDFVVEINNKGDVDE